jgi:hypothetical protein
MANSEKGFRMEAGGDWPWGIGIGIGPMAIVNPIVPTFANIPSSTLCGLFSRAPPIPIRPFRVTAHENNKKYKKKAPQLSFPHSQSKSAAKHHFVLSIPRAKHAFVKRMKGERDMREMDEIEYQNSDANSGNGKYAHKGDLMTRNGQFGDEHLGHLEGYGWKGGRLCHYLEGKR